MDTKREGEAGGIGKLRLIHIHWKWKLLSVSDFLQPPGLCSPWNSLGQNTGVGSLSLLQGVFPTQGSNPGLGILETQVLCQLSHKGSPRILKWVAYPFFSRSFQPRNWAGVSCIAGRFFTNWTIRGALIMILYITIYKIDNKLELTVYHRELNALWWPEWEGNPNVYVWLTHLLYSIN